MTEAVDDQLQRLLFAEATLVTVEHLVLTYLRGGRLVLNLRRGVVALDVRVGVRTAVRPEQHRVALREVAGIVGVLAHLHLAAVAVVRHVGRNALRDDGALGVLADVLHLRARVGLLVPLGEGDRVELADRVVPGQNDGRVLLRHGRTGLQLRPADLGVVALAETPLRDEVVDAALTGVRVARVPVLDRGVLDLGVLVGDELDDRGVELILLAHRGGAALQVAHVRAGLGDDERALKLAGAGLVDAEVGGQLHRAGHALRHVHERSVAEDRRVDRGVQVVGVRNDRAHVLPHDLGVLLGRLAEGLKDNALLLQLVLEGGGHGDAVHHGVDGHAGEGLLLLQRNAESLKRLQNLVWHLVEAVVAGRLLRGGEVANLVELGRLVVEVGPVDGFAAVEAIAGVAEGLQPPVSEPLRLVLALRDVADDVLREALRCRFCLNVGIEAMLVVLAGLAL